MFIFSAGRIVLLLISMKYLAICKTYFYYELILVMIEQFLPLNENIGTANTRILLMQTLNFLLHYFDWWPSMICALLTLPVYLYGRATLHFEPEPISADTLIYLVISMIWLFMNILICHLIITKVGFIFVDAEILRTGNE